MTIHDRRKAIQDTFTLHIVQAVHGTTKISTVMKAYRLLTRLGVEHDEIVAACPAFKEDIETQLKPADIEYPATVLAHWATGPVACCQAHAAGLQKLGSVMGASVPLTALTEPAECINCRNEAENPDND